MDHAVYVIEGMRRQAPSILVQIFHVVVVKLGKRLLKI